jgi:hypothetical protein
MTPHACGSRRPRQTGAHEEDFDDDDDDDDDNDDDHDDDHDEDHRNGS